ncbi:MAG: hypothetical protein AB1505_18565 [Candidatus Latescibacterota bacterium]
MARSADSGDPRALNKLGAFEAMVERFAAGHACWRIGAVTEGSGQVVLAGSIPW